VVLKRGISLLDLIASSFGIPLTIPSNVRDQLNRVTVVDHRSTYSEDTYVHFGTIQSDASLLPLFW
jgi:hypothetical protein